MNFEVISLSFMVALYLIWNFYPSEGENSVKFYDETSIADLNDRDINVEVSKPL